jgi:hypothetical protein
LPTLILGDEAANDRCEVVASRESEGVNAYVSTTLMGEVLRNDELGWSNRWGSWTYNIGNRDLRQSFYGRDKEALDDALGDPFPVARHICTAKHGQSCTNCDS